MGSMAFLKKSIMLLYEMKLWNNWISLRGDPILFSCFLSRGYNLCWLIGVDLSLEKSRIEQCENAPLCHRRCKSWPNNGRISVVNHSHQNNSHTYLLIVTSPKLWMWRRRAGEEDLEALEKAQFSDIKNKHFTVKLDQANKSMSRGVWVVKVNAMSCRDET